MSIKNKKDLFEVLSKKIIRSREKIVRKLRNRFLGLSKENFQPFETETSLVSEKTLVPENAFNAFISRYDVRELNGKKGVEFKFNEGKTTVRDIMRFFFLSKKKKG